LAIECVDEAPLNRADVRTMDFRYRIRERCPSSPELQSGPPRIYPLRNDLAFSRKFSAYCEYAAWFASGYMMS